MVVHVSVQNEIESFDNKVMHQKPQSTQCFLVFLLTNLILVSYRAARCPPKRLHFSLPVVSMDNGWKQKLGWGFQIIPPHRDCFKRKGCPLVLSPSCCLECDVWHCGSHADIMRLSAKLRVAELGVEKSPLALGASP